MQHFQDKVAVVTGAGSGIGLATAVQLAREGAKCALVSRSKEKLESAANLIADVSGAAPLLLPLDVRSSRDMERMASETVSRFGSIDLLVAAAGTIGSVSHDRKLPYALAQLPEQEWDLIIDTNLKGLIFSNRAVLPIMMDQHRGDIVNVGSFPASLHGSAHAAAYSASKHAVRALSEALAGEVCANGIRVQTVMPGPTDTPMLYGNNAISRHGVLTPEVVARQILHMASLPAGSTLDEAIIRAVKQDEAGVSVADRS